MANANYGLNLEVTKAKVGRDGDIKELYINDRKVEVGGGGGTEIPTHFYGWQDTLEPYSELYTMEIPTTYGQQVVGIHSGTSQMIGGAYYYFHKGEGGEDDYLSDENGTTLHFYRYSDHDFVVE